MLQKIVYLAIAIGMGAVFSWLHIPAGWLLGSLLTGMVAALFIKKLFFPDSLFKISLAIIGGNIGFMVIPEQFLTYHTLLGPFLLTLIITLISSLLLGRMMKKFSTLNHNTAFFCCLPGGASEVIALSKEYGADQRIVAAFHTTRITLFVLLVPFIVGIQTPNTGTVSTPIQWGANLSALVALPFIVFLTIYFGTRVRFPGSALFFAIALGFTAHQWIIPSSEMPLFVTGMAQALMGAIIGMRFDKETFAELRRIGAISALTLALYFCMSFGLASIFFVLTPTPFFTSLLSIVPAGAAEMASTATALKIEPTMVATLQMIRVLALFLTLPFLIHLFAKPLKNVASK
ncbi:AbrB family transcriptional regulator [Halalkalibacter urbisdiaboli]|uniref:AbrB family transcriptional regulator n=1 Tax=Halalkalibacter urbisdiaboli TaxID=1960589 RepID=UPI000B43F0CB|nr:AbrB family transcriptional regulator [Halalkalibacter urbisdiaboli]